MKESRRGYAAKGDEERGQQRHQHGEKRSGPEDPRGGGAEHHLFSEQTAQIEIELQQRGAAPAGNERLGPADDPGEQGREPGKQQKMQEQSADHGIPQGS